MADSTLILHVKGTESETTVLPKREVRAGISTGKITHSQLIWIPSENTWKQVKELPELLEGERLILHIKGTEAETQELPKHQVKSAISKGTITHSQLIWIPNESTWKPVRELPDLLPGETLILHVKGTEDETKVVPKQEVQAGVSRGQITHSQLIWVPNEHTWKPVRELPDLLPGERLILHVKGTEAETKELPRKAIKTALSKGEITHSQLIWSANEHAWKQVRDIPELLPSQKLAPAPTREQLHAVPRIVDGVIPESPSNPVARAVAAVGDIPRVRVAVAAEQPGTTPKVVVPSSGEPTVVAPKVVASGEPAIATPTVATPTVVAAEAKPQVHVAGSPPKVIPKVAAVATPQVAEAQDQPPVAAATPIAAGPVAGSVSVPAVATTTTTTPAVSVPQARMATAAIATTATPARIKAAVKAAAGAKANGPVDHKIAQEHGAHPLKWICIGLGSFIFLVVGINYLFIDEPLAANLAQSSYPGITVYGHLGAFLQPNVMVIHIRANTALTADTLPDFLVALAHSTPNSPLDGEPFTRVAITSGWTAQYSFSGYSWKELGDMANATTAQRKEDIMTRMDDASGQSILPESTMNEEAQQQQRDIIWAAFAARFSDK